MFRLGAQQRERRDLVGDPGDDGEAGGHQREDEGPRRRGGRSSGQTAFVHVVAGGLVGHQIQELGLDQLTVEVGDGVLERVLEALLAFALVTARIEAPPQDRNTL